MATTHRAAAEQRAAGFSPRGSADGEGSARGAVIFVYALFFASGFAALLYQVIWQRMLAYFSGVDVYSVTIIVSAFMAGMGFGALAGGYIADRLTLRRQLLLFALAEFAIAGFALASKWLYYDLLYIRFSFLARSQGLLAAILFLGMLWPTFFMGLSLPLLSKAMTRTIQRAARTVGALYALNTLGAAIGSVVTAWIILRRFGFETTLQIGAAINVFCAVGVLAVLPILTRAANQRAAGLNPRGSPTGETHTSAFTRDVAAFSVPTWILVYALSGFIALSLEIVWFRLLGVMLKSTTFTFPTLLGIYLGGLAIGTFIGILWAERTARAAPLFFFAQAGVTIYAGVSMGILIYLLGHTALLENLSVYFSGSEPIDMAAALAGLHAFFTGGAAPTPEVRETLGRFFALYLLLPAIVIGPPTLLMGVSFPLLQKVVQTNAAVLGRRVGWLQTANIFGSTLGAILASWLLLRFFGTAGTFRILVALGGVFLILLVRLHARSGPGTARLGYALSVAAALAAALIAPRADHLWARLHGTTTDAIVFREDATGLSLLKLTRDGDYEEIGIFVNGLSHSWIPYGGIHTMLGGLPVMLHPRPESVMIVGLGSADTLFSAAARAETQSVHCVEIIAPQLETLREMHRRRPYGGLETVLTDPRIDIRFGDGRAALMLDERTYDLIEADALRPHSAYSGNLYSAEFFTLMKERLNPGGWVVSWAPTPRVVRTFASVFPHVLLWGDILIGGNEPLMADLALAQTRLLSPSVAAYYRQAEIDVEQMLRYLRRNPPQVVVLRPDDPLRDDINRDLFPRDEYLVPER
jgi:spermidine synthase